MTKKDGNKRNWKSDLLPYLPETAAKLLCDVDAYTPLEEIRLRAGAPVQLCFSGYERLLYGSLGRPPVDAEDCKCMLQKLCRQSLYAWEGELAAGFVTLEGGYRVGLCGRLDAAQNGHATLTDVTGFNIRIAREVPGCAAGILPMLLDAEGHLCSTLIVSPPGCGKTTLLRDVARCCSYGLYGVRPMRVAVVDTRYELSGAVRGVSQLDLGPRTDVLSGAKRALGMRMMVVNLSPEILVTDELATMEDAYAVYDAICAGAVVVASAHAPDINGLLKRRSLAALYGGGLIARTVFLGRSRGVGTVEAVFDAALNRLDGVEAKEVGACCAYLPH